MEGILELQKSNHPGNIAILRWTDQVRLEWPEHRTLERYQKELQAMRDAQNYDFELAMDSLQASIPVARRLDIFIQAMLATSAMHLAAFK